MTVRAEIVSRTDTVAVRLAPVSAVPGPPVVLVPGLAAGPMPFVEHPEESLATVLTRQGLQPWTADFSYSWRHRGPGFQDLLAVLDSALDALVEQCGCRRSDVLAIGHSLGGTLLLAMQVGKEPLGGVVALASGVDFRQGGLRGWPARLEALAPMLSSLQVRVGGGIPTRSLARLIARAAGSHPDTKVLGLQFHPGTTEPSHIEAVLSQGVRDLPLRLLLDLAALYAPPGLRLPDDEPLVAALHRISAPLLLVAARQDQQCPLAAVADVHQRTPSGSLLEVGHSVSAPRGPGYGHLDLLCGARAPRDVFAPVAGFLRSAADAAFPEAHG